MSIKFRLTAMQFLQFFVWGAWLISLGGYMGGTLHFEGGQIGACSGTFNPLTFEPGTYCKLGKRTHLCGRRRDYIG